MKLLIVDDNPKMRIMLKEFLGGCFEEIFEHDDGLGADELYDQIKPDWVLMDIKMKRLDGINATRNILKINSAAKVIIISQFNEENILRDAISAGAQKFYNKDDLTKLINFFQNVSSINKGDQK